MGQYIVLGCTVIVTLALIADVAGTIHLVITIITVKGITFIMKKVVDSFSKDNGDIVNFVGNCAAGISAVGLIRNALRGVEPVTSVLGRVGMFVNQLGVTMDRVSEFIERLPFGLD